VGFSCGVNSEGGEAEEAGSAALLSSPLDGSLAGEESPDPLDAGPAPGPDAPLNQGK
jgi:hypothetical protein